MVKRAHRAIIIFLSRLEEKKMQAKKEELAYKGKKLSLNELWIIIVLCVCLELHIRICISYSDEILVFLYSQRRWRW